MRPRPLLCALALLTLSAGAQAQIFAVRLKDEKAEKKYRKHLVDYQGRSALIGEIGDGFAFKADTNTIQWQPSGNNELFVADPSDPSKVPYVFEDGEKVPASKKSLVAISGTHIDKVEIVSVEESLAGLAQEYRLRVDLIEAHRAERDAAPRDSAAWAARHVRLVAAMQRLQSWLEKTAYPKAAEKLGKELEREEKVVRKEALRARAETALASIRPVDPPPELVELAQKISAGEDTFRGQESQHLRIWYVDTITDEEVTEALRVGESIIEDFRAELVDPYLDEGYPDYVPDELFHEFLFVPQDLRSYEEYATGFYGARFTENRERVLEMSGGNTLGRRGVRFNTYWKDQEQTYLPGIIAHRLGHSLASLHYGKGRSNLQLDWLEEAVAYHVSFEFFGNNIVTCFAFDRTKQRYVKRERERQEGGKTVAEGRRDTYNEVALTEGRPIEQLALRSLFEMDDPDLCKAWSFYDYVVRKEGKAGQEWLRAAGQFAPQKQTLVQKWREAAAEILGVSPSQAFDAVEDRWRAFAEALQDTSGAPRKGR